MATWQYVGHSYMHNIVGLRSLSCVQSLEKDAVFYNANHYRNGALE